MKLRYCGACTKEKGVKTPIKGQVYTASYTANNKNYSHFLCKTHAKDAKKYGITIEPDIKD